MKKLFTFFVFALSCHLNSQTSLKVWALSPDQSTTVTAVGNGDTVYYSVSANQTKTVFFQFKNNAAVTNTYSVKRTDLILQAHTHAFFCFGDQGTCYQSSTYVVTSDYATLGPGQSTVQNSGPPFHADTNLSTDMQDTLPAASYSVIMYKLFNIATGQMGADTLNFKIIYNPTLSGIKENSSSIVSASDIYPNPSTNNANITVVLIDESPVKIQVFNSLGSLVYNGNEQKLAGKNKLSVDCANFNSGLYFVTVTAGDSKITKRLVINK
ncbi:MAG TPA: T9SS type A sorting domain-containing protein [Bacteroidia bacterium]|jgi:hypothetical protein|nr:T9SS type A sorting domain-containing protein [Bacteroidia bacterium]